MKRTRERANRIKMVTASALLIAVAFFSILMFQQRSLEVAKERVYETLQTSAAQQTRVFNTMLGNRFDMLTMAAQELAYQGALDNEVVQNLIYRLQEFGKYRTVWVTNRDGSAYSDLEMELRVGDRAYFRRSLMGEKVLEKVDSRVDGATIFVVSVPIMEIGQRGLADGVLFAVLEMDSFQENLVEEAFDEQGYSFVCQSNGDVIIGANDQGSISAGYNVLDILEQAVFEEGQLEQFRVDLAAGRSGLVAYTLAGAGVQYAVYEPLGVNDWMILNVVDGHVVEQSVAETARNGYILVGIILIVTLATLALLSFSSRRQRERLRYEADHDALTGLYTRPAFIGLTAQRVRGQAPGRYVVCCVDIENFKVINDQFGYEEGDRVLCFFAHFIRMFFTTQKQAILCRDSADIFLILAEYTPNMAEQMQKQNQKDVTGSGLPFPVRTRFGLYVVDDMSLPVESMIDRAMLAQRTVKGAASTNLMFYDEGMRQSILRQQQIVGVMETALEQEQFTLHLQPQFDQFKGTVVGAEVLARWTHPVLGSISPGEFIPIFEKNGFITKLDYYIWEKTCQLLHKWRQAGQAVVSLSVNVSRMDLLDPLLCCKLCALLERYALPTELLRLEITESACSDAPEQLMKTLRELQACGFFIEMDDFGKGYSSLNSLKDIPVDMLKLDMNFISNDISGSRGGIILSSVVQMTHWLNIPVIAEGVESMHQASFLKSIGCSLVQGFLYAKPMSVDAFEKYLRENRLSALESGVEIATFFNSDGLWNPAALDTIIFNSIMGAAGIFECSGDQVIPLRLNDTYYETIGLSPKEYEKHRLHLMDLLEAEDVPVWTQMLDRASRSNREEESITRWNIPQHTGTLWLRIRVRQIARSAHSFVIYAMFEDVSQQQEQMLRDQQRYALLENLSQTVGPTGEEPSARDETINERVFRLLYESMDIEQTVLDILGVLGRYFDVSRAYIFEELDDHQHVSNTFEWCADGVEPQKELLQNLSYREDFGCEGHDLFDEEGLYYYSDFSKLSPQQREQPFRQGVQAMVRCAIEDGGVICGMVCFDECRGPRTWTDDQIHTLSWAARLLGAFLRKKRSEESAAFSKDFMAAIDSFEAFTYIIDPQSYEVAYKNKAIRETVSWCDASVSTCYEEFMRRSTPCPTCPLREVGAGYEPAMELRRPDGTWVLAQASPLQWGGRELALVTCTDITEHKKASEALRIRNEEYSIVLQQSNKAVFRYDMDTGLCQWLHLTDVEGSLGAWGANTPEAAIDAGEVSSDTIQAYRDFFGSIRQGEPIGSCNVKMRTVGEQYVWHHLDYTLVYGEDGQPSHAIISRYENSEQIERDLAYAKWRGNLESLLAESSVYIEVNLTTDELERHEHTAEEGLGHISRTLSQYAAFAAARIVDPEDARNYLEFLDRNRLLGLFQSGVYEDSMEYRSLASGERQWYRANIQMVKHPYSNDIKAFMVFTNINEQRQLLEQLAESATHDAMTHLLNRETLRERTIQLTQNAAEGARFAMFIVDLDNFKQVNDKLGHQRGDDALMHSAEILQKSFRGSDLVGRLGGDEFIVLMTGNVTLELVRKKALRLLQGLQFMVGNVQLSASVGAVMAEKSHADYTRLYQLADRALYEAKRAGKNRYRIFDEKSSVQSPELDMSMPEVIQLQSLLENMDAGIVIAEVGESVRLIYANENVLKPISGLAKCNHDAMENLLAMVHPEDRPGLYQAAQLVAQTGEVQNYTYRMNQTEPAWHHVRIAMLPGVMGEFCRLQGIVTDVTAVKTSMRLIEALVDNSPVGIAIYRLTKDWGLQTVYLNEKVLAVTGLDRSRYQEVVAPDATVVIHPEDLSRVQQVICENQGKKTYEVTCRSNPAVCRQPSRIRAVVTDLGYDHGLPLLQVVFAEITPLSEDEASL